MPLLPDDYHELMNPLEGMSISEANAYFESNLRNLGTNIDANKADPQGDGDQSPVNDQFYRDMYAMGGDINLLASVGLSPLTDFAKYCIMGNVEQVSKILERLAGKDQDLSPNPSPELIRLLETRETALRLSPLMMLVSIGKNLNVEGEGNIMESQQVQVAELLLRYGARPDARDVIGKTVCHYGMGAMATSMTLKVANMCIEAHESSHLFGKKVELHSLKTASKNGMQGVCRGYMWSQGRRVVYSINQQGTIAVKPENLKLLKDTTNITTKDSDNLSYTKLCDIPDRLGQVCLLEVIMKNRQDVASILLNDHHANLDVKDCDGVSPRSMSANNGMMSSVAVMVNKASGKQAKQQRKIQSRKCFNCGVEESANSDIKLQACSICNKVQYCGKECQTEHWKFGGHKKECKKLAASQQMAIVLERPSNSEMHFVSMNFQAKRRGKNAISEASTAAEGYKKPRGIRFDEKFDVKVQGSGPECPLMVYDQSRECNFSVNPGSSGFDELRKAVNAEPAWQGRKTFVAASFDREGNCTVYPGITSIHKW